jgi:hypothetical protein
VSDDDKAFAFGFILALALGICVGCWGRGSYDNNLVCSTLLAAALTPRDTVLLYRDKPECVNAVRVR